MQAREQTLIVKFLSFLGKQLTIFLFLILPSKVTSIFVSLSVLSLINTLRTPTTAKLKIDEAKFKSLLFVTYQEDIMLLPNKTLSWFWAEDFLKKKITLRGNKVAIKEAIVKDEYLYSNLKAITMALLNNVPKLLLYKLRFKDLHKRLELNHNVVNLLLAQT